VIRLCSFCLVENVFARGLCRACYMKAYDVRARQFFKGLSVGEVLKRVGWSKIRKGKRRLG